LDEISQAIDAARRNAVGIAVRDRMCTSCSSKPVLRAETSCNFFWGDAWLQRCHDDFDQATDSWIRQWRAYSPDPAQLRFAGELNGA
jgi:4-alpha-glucanotransferase